MLLEKLTNASGVSGNEKEIRDIIIEEIRDYVDEVKIDKIGNLIVYKKNKREDKRIMLAAHMDEIGMMVRDIDEYGLIKFIPVGGIDKRVLVSKTVLVGENKIPGVIGAKPIHLQKREEWKNPLEINSLYIDIGATSKEEAKKHVSIGDYISFDSKYMEFGDNLIKAKALDDRVGCSILIDLIKNHQDTSFYAAFTVMEELGLVGAGPASYSINPDVAIIFEGTICYDLPSLDGHLIPTKLGEGPAISLIDRTTIYDKELRDTIVKIAEENKIKYQYRKTSMGGNDSGKIHLSKDGCKTAALSIPCRNIHTPNSVMSLNDYNNTYKLADKILSEI